MDHPPKRSAPSGGRARIIKAYKHGWPRIAVDAMIFRRTRTTFYAVRAQGLDRLRAALDADPSGVVFIGNHSCWWDVFLAHVLNELIPVEGYGMMEHFNLRRFGFFRRIGCFSVDRSDPASLRESIEYTAELLVRPRAGVWIFPQGRMAHNDLRPLGFQPGLRALLRYAGRLRVVTAALRFEFWEEERPEVFVRFGDPSWYERDQVSTILEHTEAWLTGELNSLKLDVASLDSKRFETILSGAGSINDRIARVHARLFGATPGAPPLDRRA